MKDEITFEELYHAYLLCLKNKKRKAGTYNFVNYDLCKNLINLLDDINNRTYLPRPSNCYVITDPALREIYAAQFRDRILQHFYLNEIEDLIEGELVNGCCSCRINKGTDYALKLLKKYLENVSNKGKKDCFFLKIDLSGYFMSINRKFVSNKFSELIVKKYKGNHKEILLYLTPIIFENNPARGRIQKYSEKLRAKVPDRRKMQEDSILGMAIGNLSAQAGSNINLNEFDHFVVEKLGLQNYIRYVDDIVIIDSSKEKLYKSLPYIIEKLEETHQKINLKKTKIDTAYHGVAFLGRVSYPYGYQKPKKENIIRTYQKAKELIYIDKYELLAKVNSQIGTLKNHNCRKLIIEYSKIIMDNTEGILNFDNELKKFYFIEEGK